MRFRPRGIGRATHPMSSLLNGEYLETPEGRLAQYRRRFQKRIQVSIKDVEPRSKQAMPDEDKDEIQRQVLHCLVKRRRLAFRGPLALKLELDTTDKNPSHAHTIAKNVLDLLARPRRNLITSRNGLLYFDDQQVDALSVSCSHGNEHPSIFVSASPLAAFLEDVGLAMLASKELEDGPDKWERSRHFDEAIEHLTDLSRNEARDRELLGDHNFDFLLELARRKAQEQMLGRAKVSVLDLAYMYGVPKETLPREFAARWEQLFCSTPLRIILSELPQVDGASRRYKEEVESRLREFQTKLGWLIDPLLVPVALEVMIRPPPMTRRRGLHDLDNVLRDYLIPRVVEILKPPSDTFWAFRNDKPLRRDPEFYHGGSVRRSMPPASTRLGVTRYEAWRLPPAGDDFTGFVSVAVVADTTGEGDVFWQIDREIERWEEAQR